MLVSLGNPHLSCSFCGFEFYLKPKILSKYIILSGICYWAKTCVNLHLSMLQMFDPVSCMRLCIRTHAHDVQSFGVEGRVESPTSTRDMVYIVLVGLQQSSPYKQSCRVKLGLKPKSCKS